MCLFSKLTSVEFWSPCDVMPHNFLISLLACFPSHPFNNLFFFSCWWSYMYFIGFGSFAELQKWICSLLTQYLLKFYPILKFACEKKFASEKYNLCSLNLLLLHHSLSVWGETVLPVAQGKFLQVLLASFAFILMWFTAIPPSHLPNSAQHPRLSHRGPF